MRQVQEHEGPPLKGRRRTLKEGAKMRSEDDLLGSYTGVPDEGDPVQDADDL